MPRSSGSRKPRIGDIVSLARRGATDELVAKAQQVDREFHEAVIDELDNDIISKAYRVNWIKVRLIRQNETNLNEDLVSRSCTSTWRSLRRSRRATRQPPSMPPRPTS